MTRPSGCAGTSRASSGVRHLNLVPYVEEITQHGVFVSDDALADARLAPLHDGFLDPLGIRAVLYATIGANGSMSSLLGCAERGAPRRWSAIEVRALKAYADAISLRRARRRRREAEAASLSDRLLQGAAATPVPSHPVGDAG